jgi:drug/metabolite transporter (DMT)-like permease
MRSGDAGSMTRQQHGMTLGLMGVFIFSGSMPATRAAVAGFDPTFLTAARALLAAMIGAIPLFLLSAAVPTRRELGSLALVAACVVVAFPLLSAIALTQMPSARAILFTGLLPIATAFWAFVRGGERPRRAFWAFAVAGALCVGGFAMVHGAGDEGVHVGDALMLAAILLCGLGYAEGAVLTRRLGGWQVICWALLLAAPIMLFLAWQVWPAGMGEIAPSAWAGLLYVSIFSMLVGFIFWYRGLALGGTAGVGQLQLLQPLLAFGLTALVLREPVGLPTLAAGFAVLVCVAGARRFA